MMDGPASPGEGAEPCGLFHPSQGETTPSVGQSSPRSLPDITPLPECTALRQLLGVKNWVRGTTHPLCTYLMSQ